MSGRIIDGEKRSRVASVQRREKAIAKALAMSASERERDRPCSIPCSCMQAREGSDAGEPHPGLLDSWSKTGLQHDPELSRTHIMQGHALLRSAARPSRGIAQTSLRFGLPRQFRCAATSRIDEPVADL